MAKRVPLVNHYDLVLLDLDGVVYRGGQAVEGAKEAISLLGHAGIDVGYVTNNSSRDPEQIAEQLRGFGLTLQTSQVISSAEVAGSLLAELVPPPATVLVVGGQGLRNAVSKLGYRVVDDAREKPLAVIQGYSSEVGWVHLAEASFAIQAGAKWIATNQDWTLPLERGLAPGNGTLVSAVHTAVGQLPVFAGKPATPIFDLAVKRFGAKRPLFIGDRLDTDIKGANASGMDSAVVMTGVTNQKDLLGARSDERPTFILKDLMQLFEPANEPRQTKYGYKHGGVEVELLGSKLRVTAGDPQSFDAVRAACALVWSSDKSIHMMDVDSALLNPREN